MKYLQRIPIVFFIALLGSVAREPPSVAAEPATCPPLGITLRAEFVRARDADTIEWRIAGSSFVWASRLIDTWAPEVRGSDAELKAIAIAGKVYAKEQCEKSKKLRVFIPFSIREQPLKALSFDRIPSYVYLDDFTTLNSAMVRAGYASTTKGGKLGE
jgi:endonuclease YncB( thermonuclease family)